MQRLLFCGLAVTAAGHRAGRLRALRPCRGHHVAGLPEHLCAEMPPLGGTALFAFLALAGDLGATLSPTMVGYISELAGGNLKTGLLGASAFPILLVLTLLLIKGAKATRSTESP